MVKKTIEIDGKKVSFKASAAVPRIYRAKYQRELFYDMSVLQESLQEKAEKDIDLSAASLQIFEDVAYAMAYHADPKEVPDTADEWLEQFDTFSIYQVVPELIELWGKNIQQEVESRKKLKEVTDK